MSTFQWTMSIAHHNWTSEKTHDHLDICAADGTSTSLTFHLVLAGVTKMLVVTWHKCHTCVMLSHEVCLAVVHVAGWCSDTRDDAVCASSSVRLFFIRQVVAVCCQESVGASQNLLLWVLTLWLTAHKILHAVVTVVIETTLLIYAQHCYAGGHTCITLSHKVYLVVVHVAGWVWW